MKDFTRGNRFALLSVIIGIAVALALIFFAVSNGTRGNGNSLGIPLASELWIHAPAVASAGREYWYNFTLAVNQSIPIEDFGFLLYLPGGVIATPPGLNLSGKSGVSLTAVYNLSLDSWTLGVGRSLLPGDSLNATLSGETISGDILKALPSGGPYSGYSAVLIY